MPDIPAMTVAVGLAKTLFDSAKEAYKAKKGLDEAFLIRSLSELQLALAEANKELLSKDSRIRELELALKYQGDLVRKDQFFFQLNENGEPAGDPFCPQCWESDRKAIHVITFESGMQRCPACKTTYRAAPLVVA